MKKPLSNFEDYPNDIARGFNIAHMPVYYQVEAQNKYVYSPSLLVQVPEPDFSMPFNVNAVTHMILGIFFVNTIFILYTDPQDKIDEKKNPRVSPLQQLKNKIFGKKE